MTCPETEAIIREVRSDVLAIFNRATDPETKRLADEAYKKLSTVLRPGDG